MDGLYVVVRGDLTPGLQVAQACHAAREFTSQYSYLTLGENLVVLQVPDEPSLARVVADCRGYHVAPFHEPDLGGQMTAIAVSGAAQGKLSCLPLALRAG